MPIGQRDVGTAGVVGPQQIGHDHEEIVEPPLPQCVQDWQVAIAFAKRFFLHMGMRHTVVGSRRNRIECHDAIVSGMTVTQIIPGELYLKSPKVNAFKFDGLGRYRNLPRLEINPNILEFVIQRSEVIVNVTEVADRRSICVIDDGIVYCLERTLEFA